MVFRQANLEWVGRPYSSPVGQVPTSGNHHLNWPLFWQFELRGLEGKRRIPPHCKGRQTVGGSGGRQVWGAWWGRGQGGGHCVAQQLSGGEVCFVDAHPVPLSTLLEGHPYATENEWKKIFSFSSSNFFPWYWWGPPTPLNLFLHSSLCSCQEGKSYVYTWNQRPYENTKLCTHSSASQDGHTKPLPWRTCDCVGRASLLITNLHLHPTVLPSYHRALPLAHLSRPILRRVSENKSEPKVMKGEKKLSEYWIKTGSKNIDIPIRKPLACSLL